MSSCRRDFSFQRAIVHVMPGCTSSCWRIAIRMLHVFAERIAPSTSRKRWRGVGVAMARTISRWTGPSFTSTTRSVGAAVVTRRASRRDSTLGVHETHEHGLRDGDFDRFLRLAEAVREDDGQRLHRDLFVFGTRERMQPPRVAVVVACEVGEHVSDFARDTIGCAFRSAALALLERHLFRPIDGGTNADEDAPIHRTLTSTRLAMSR